MNDFLTNYFKNPKDKQDFWIALVVIALFLGSIIYSIFPFGENATPVSFFEESEESVSTELSTLVIQKEDKTITKEVLSDKLLVKKLDNWIDSVKTDIVPIGIWENRIENYVDKPDEEEMVEVETNQEDTTSITQDTIIEETTESAIVTEDTPDATTDNMITSEEIVEKPSTTTETDTKSTEIEKPTKVEPKPITPKKDKPKAALPKCVIIVGAFAKRHNADKVINQLEKAKYTVHTFYRKGRLAVSVTHNCKDEKGLQAKLKVLKKQYKDAWILR